MDDPSRRSLVDAVMNIDNCSREDTLEVIVRLCAGIFGVTSFPDGVRSMDEAQMDKFISMLRTMSVMLIYLANKDGYDIGNVCDLVVIAIQEAYEQAADLAEAADGK